MTFFEYFLVEAFENAYATWVKSGASEEAVELAVDAFKLLKQRQILKGSEGDISPWVKKPFPEFQKFVQEKQAQFQQKNLQKQTASAGGQSKPAIENLRQLKHREGTKGNIGTGSENSAIWREGDRVFKQSRPSKDVPKSLAYWKDRTESHNSLFGTDAKIEGVTDKGAIVRSEPFHEGTHPTEREVTDFMESHGATRLPALGKNAWKIGNHRIEDAHPGNFFKTKDGKIVPFDLQAGEIPPLPSRAVREKVLVLDDKTRNWTEATVLSREGAPQEVGGNFYCVENQLTSLEGAPQEVGGDFSCDRNPIPEKELLKTRNTK